MTEADELDGRGGIASADSPATAPAASADPLWYPPLPLGKLALLLTLTLGFYSPFYFYRAAREIRDHAKPGMSPWLYPLSLLIGIAAAIAASRLARSAQDFAGPERKKKGSGPMLVGPTLLVAFIAIGVAEFVPYTSFYLLALALFVLPWLLLQRQLNAIKAGLPDSAFRSRPNRYTWLQIAGLVPGCLLTAAVGFTLVEDVVRFSGQALLADEVYTDPMNRFEFTVPRDGWSVVGPNYLADDSDLELLGPGENDWAVLYVHDRRGWTVDELVEFRFHEMRDSVSSYSEVRQLIGEQEIPVSYAKYSGATALEGELDYLVTSFAQKERAVELIVHTAGRRRGLSGADEIARSLRPVPAP